MAMDIAVAAPGWGDRAGRPVPGYRQRGFGRLEFWFIIGSATVILAIVSLTVDRAHRAYERRSTDVVMRQARRAVDGWARALRRVRAPTRENLVMGRQAITFTTIHHTTYTYRLDPGGVWVRTVNGGTAQLLVGHVTALDFIYLTRNGRTRAQRPSAVSYIGIRLTVVHGGAHKTFRLTVAPRAFT